jgi:hypothetical protein
MNKRAAFLLLAVIVLGAVYVLKFTDWFTEKNIHILFRSRGKSAFFGLENREYKLNSVKVFRAEEVTTNKYARPLWHLVATTDKGSDPVTDFTYGSAIPGMKAAIDGTTPEPLQKNVKYRIFVEAQKQNGQMDFNIK